MVSTTVMVQRLSGLVGTTDLNEWEKGFVQSLQQRVDAGEVTRLTDKQVETLDQLHAKHFGG